MKYNVKINVIPHETWLNYFQGSWSQIAQHSKWCLLWIIWWNLSLWKNSRQYLRVLNAIKHKEKFSQLRIV